MVEYCNVPYTDMTCRITKSCPSLHVALYWNDTLFWAKYDCSAVSVAGDGNFVWAYAKC